MLQHGVLVNGTDLTATAMPPMRMMYRALAAYRFQQLSVMSSFHQFSVAY